MTGPHLDEEPARFARYLQTLENVAEEDESDLVAAVLRDEDADGGQRGGRHLDRRPADRPRVRLLGPNHSGDPGPRTLFRTIVLGKGVAPDCFRLIWFGSAPGRRRDRLGAPRSAASGPRP